MNTEKTWQTVSSKPEDTLKIAEQLAGQCRGGEVFLLASDVGGGKTTFTKGLAAGLKSGDVVSSPTFMVSRIYSCRDNIQLHHFDFYRLETAGIMANELNEVLEDPKNIVVVEWGDIVSDVLPINHITITFERLASNEDDRKITVSYPETLAYIAKELA